MHAFSVAALQTLLWLALLAIPAALIGRVNHQSVLSNLGLGRVPVSIFNGLAAAVLVAVGSTFGLTGLVWIADAGLANSIEPDNGLGKLLVWSFISTALPEEIIFRSILLKGLRIRMSFLRANAVQARLFGAIHIGAFEFNSGSMIQLTSAILAVIVVGVAGFLFGLLNERYGGGTLYLGWLSHGTVNVLSRAFASIVG